MTDERRLAGEDDTRLLVLDKSKFMYLLRNQPDFALVVMGKLCRQLRSATTPLCEGNEP
jgi:CRP-like cAMP-binding protein